VEKPGKNCGKRNKIVEKIVKIGLIGTGLMGAPMALKLLERGYDVAAHNRTADKLAPLATAGVTVFESPTALLQHCDGVILMLSDAKAIAQTLFTPSAKAALPSKTIIQMGTIAPQQSRDLCQTVEAAGGEYLEAPVLGSIPQVSAASLIVMVGATAAQFEQWQPLFQAFCPEPLHLGSVGTAAATKLAMNQLIGSLTTAFALSLALVRREGIEVEQFMHIVRSSALYAPTFDKKLDRLLTRNFDNPNFPTKHLLKDMKLFSQAAQAAGLDPLLSDSVGQVVQRAIDLGLAEADYSALYEAIDPLED
jgi:3-hydroxyisobutyrate dehydrogenase